MSENCLECLLLLGLSLLFFLGAIAVYFIFFTLFPRIFKRGHLGRRLIKSAKLPTFCLLIELAAFLSFNLFDISPAIDVVFSHFILIITIGTVGFLLANLLKAWYRYVMEHYDSLIDIDHSKRSMITQLQFLYRSLLFFVVIFSLASILMTFPPIRSMGVGILGSAGILGIALGIAARPILLNFISGFQIAITKMVKIGDAVVVEGQQGRVEHIYLTHVLVKLSDLRRIVVPISYFIDKPFENWSCFSTELIAVAHLHCDYSVSIEKVRQKLYEILQTTPLWDQKVWSLLVTDTTESTVKIRTCMSAKDASDAFMLKCYVLEHLLAFVYNEETSALPQSRIFNLN